MRVVRKKRNLAARRRPIFFVEVLAMGGSRIVTQKQKDARKQRSAGGKTYEALSKVGGILKEQLCIVAFAQVFNGIEANAKPIPKVIYF